MTSGFNWVGVFAVAGGIILLTTAVYLLITWLRGKDN